MYSSPNGEHEQELDRMRDLIRQYQKQETETAELLLKQITLNTDLQQRVDDFERENVLRSPLRQWSVLTNTSTEPPPTCHDVSGGAIGRNTSATNDNKFTHNFTRYI